jgi:hypothetical protein
VSPRADYAESADSGRLPWRLDCVERILSLWWPGSGRSNRVVIASGPRDDSARAFVYGFSAVIRALGMCTPQQAASARLRFHVQRGLLSTSQGVWKRGPGAGQFDVTRAEVELSNGGSSRLEGRDWS